MTTDLDGVTRQPSVGDRLRVGGDEAPRLGPETSGWASGECLRYHIVDVEHR